MTRGNNVIAIQGIVGSGKTTLSKMLSTEKGMALFPEPVETNPYLEKFYEDPSSFSFQMQVFLLQARFRDMMTAQGMDKMCVMDASTYTNDLFARLHYKCGYMQREDYYMNYLLLSNTFKELMDKPRLMVYLRCSTEIAVQRIMKRGRGAELSAPLSYWYKFNDIYEEWYKEYNDSPKIVIPVSEIDIVSDPVAADWAIAQVMLALR